MALQGEGVLLFAGDMILAGHVFGGNTVVVRTEGPGENVYNAIFKGLMPHACSPSRVLYVIG